MILLKQRAGVMDARSLVEEEGVIVGKRPLEAQVVAVIVGKVCLVEEGALHSDEAVA